jgi:hypothetical protein
VTQLDKRPGSPAETLLEVRVASKSKTKMLIGSDGRGVWRRATRERLMFYSNRTGCPVAAKTVLHQMQSVDLLLLKDEHLNRDMDKRIMQKSEN